MTDPASDRSRYPVLAGSFRWETVERRSRFLTLLEPITCEQDAHDLVARARAEYPDASHHCWAFLVGPPGSTSRVGSSDAGEPHGTAGRPMLDALVHGGLGDLGVVVARWFGGVKLGKGGLVRAYGGAVTAALAAAPRGQRTRWVQVGLEASYADAELLRRVYAAHEAELLEERFDERVHHRLRLPEDLREALERAVVSATAGRARPVDQA